VALDPRLTRTNFERALPFFFDLDFNGKHVHLLSIVPAYVDQMPLEVVDLGLDCSTG
jgi:hypothetical protein